MKIINTIWLIIATLTIIQASSTEALIYKALYQKSQGEILEYKHTLAKAIKQSDKNSSIAKTLYWNSSLYTGKLKEYLSVEGFDDIHFVELSRDRNLLYVDTQKSKIVWDINHSKVLLKVKKTPRNIEHWFRGFDYYCKSHISGGDNYFLDIDYIYSEQNSKGNIRVWDINRKKILLDIEVKKLFEVYFIDDNRFIISSYRDENSEFISNNKIELWDIEKGKKSLFDKKKYQNLLKEKKRFIKENNSSYMFNSNEFKRYSAVPLKYIESNYSVHLSPFDINITTKESKIDSSSEYFTLPHSPLFGSDYVIFSRYDSNSGNLGYPVVIKSYENETMLTYDNQYNINDMFLTPKGNFLISYTPNQINITPLNDSGVLNNIRIDTFVDGVKYLKDGLVAYWYENKISIVKIYQNRYKKVATLYNIKDINNLFFDEKYNELMVIGEQSFARWDISMVFEYPNSKEIELNQKNKLATYIGVPRVRSDEEKEMYVSDLKNGLEIGKESITLFDTKSNKKIYTIKHHFLTNEMDRHSQETTSAQLSEDKKKILSWSCFKGQDLDEGCFCKLYLTDIESGINLIAKDDGCIAKASFTKKNNGIYVKYHNENDKSKFYRLENFSTLLNNLYPLQTTINTATEYKNGALNILTPKEWKKIKVEK